MRAGVAHGGLVSAALFSLYVNDMPTAFRHVELAPYADDTALIAMSRSPLLLVRYLETYLNRPELWLRDWRIAMLCVKSEDAFVITCVANFMEVKVLYVQQDLRYEISSY
jgi:hypothetical protein